jgi:hypothetical protein
MPVKGNKKYPDPHTSLNINIEDLPVFHELAKELGLDGRKTFSVLMRTYLNKTKRGETIQLEI